MFVKYLFLRVFVSGNNLDSNSEMTGRRRGSRWSMKFPSYFPSLNEFRVTGKVEVEKEKMREERK